MFLRKRLNRQAHQAGHARIRYASMHVLLFGPRQALGLADNGLGWSLIVAGTPFAAIFGAQFSAGPLDR